ncbi:MAG: ABC transporter permease [Gammaproteobacteria bacterium]|nr:ABC transporter permease [Gammaproteobacteria bacterium]MCP5426209.1 ABC transporter permease [Gammaproteobacteria bacterium]
MWQRVWALLIKEFLALMKDKKSRFVLIGPPIVQVLVFGYAASFDLNEVPYAVYNEDRGQASRQLLAAFQGSPHFHPAAQIDRAEAIAPLVDSAQVLLVVRIGPQFSRQLALGQSAPLQVIVDGRDSNTALIVLNYINQILLEFNRRWMVDQGESGPPAHLEVRAWFNPNLESRWFFVPGIAGMLILVVAMLVTALSVAREREQGTFDQLLVTPLRPVEILLGKALPGFIIGLVQASAIVLVAVYWFDVPLLGSLWTLYTGIVLFLLSVIGVGLMISSLAVTQQQGLLGGFLFLVPANILSGFATPIANMPPLVQAITLINPVRYFMVVLRGVFLEATPFHLLLDQFWPMAVIAVVCLAVAGGLFRHRMY